MEWTTTKLLDWIVGYFQKAGIDSPRIRAEMLLSYVLGVQRIMLYISTPVAPDKLDKLRSLVKQAAEQKPIEYIIGSTTFYSMKLNVSEATLIPRPETEDVVKHAIDLLRSMPEGEQVVCDMCTGSGCIAAAIAKNIPDCRLAACDISADALEVAKSNIDMYNLSDRVRLIEGDMFAPLAEYAQSGFDMIVSNPPYVSKAEYEGLDKNVRDYEPQAALLAGEGGLEFYRIIAENCERFLKPTGAVVLEIGFEQAADVCNIFDSLSIFSSVKSLKDFAGNDRIVIAQRQ